MRASSRVLPHATVGLTIAGIVLGLGEGTARAQSAAAPTDAEACFEAAEKAQPLLRDHKLRAARQALLVCARDACPRAVRNDCHGWLDQVSRSLPSVVLRAREARKGGDVAVDDVRVTADGEVVVAARLDDAPIPLDAGAHVLRFEHGGATVERKIDLREGDSRLLLEVVFGGASGSGTSSTAATPAVSGSSTSDDAGPAPHEADEGADRPMPALVWGLLGGGVVGLGVGAAFEIAGLSKRSQLAGSCQPTRTCAQSDVDTAHTQVLAGDVVLAVSAALLGGAAYFYFTRSSAEPARASALRLGLAPLPGGVMGALELGL